MPSTHVLTWNGSTHLELSPGRAPDLIRRALSRLDGDESFALSLARLPRGGSLADRPSDVWPTCFLQSAGSAGRMTVEMRSEVGGEVEHVVVGRAQQDASELETIAWPGGSQRVQRSEVFDADEATAIYLHYLEHDAVPHPYVTRVLTRS